MKRTIFVLIATLSFLSCSKDNNLLLNDKLNATIDGVAWKSATRVTVLNDSKFFITGTSLDGKSLNITIMGTTEGTYLLNLSSIQFGAVYKESLNASATDAYEATSGTVELSSVNTTSKEISGTFNFILRRGLSLTDTLKVTEGAFNNLRYTEGQPQ